MSVPLSIGDIATILSMANCMYRALSDAQGSAKDYQETVKEVHGFRADLDIINSVAVPLALASNAAVAASIRDKVEKCDVVTNRFLERVERYDATLGARRRRGKVFTRTCRKISWWLWHAEEASEVKQQLNVTVNSISMILQVLNL
ncbi:hypothetical protein EVJ58_g7358 [Rhodofomes roseus]|uniref:Fungal N-terminal domain-containing protein n=1 Tax=Rhodofomes roseus TaxID=34475 RepID=A0A4Y9Y338_9APHY|nr:hypothetical protein EVJ58_g7358 [Rhodofomes roseus]